MSVIQEQPVLRMALATGPAAGQAVPVDKTTPLPVVLSSGGATNDLANPSSDGVSTVVPTVGTRAFGYVFNGTTWDRVRGDGGGIWVAGSLYYTDTTTALGASGVATGNARAAGGSPGATRSPYTRFRVEVYADQAGTLYVEKTVDGGVTWRPSNGAAGTPVAAATTVLVDVPITTSNIRYRFLNGATAQGAFLVTSALMSGA
jgi:hypothetical protein